MTAQAPAYMVHGFSPRDEVLLGANALPVKGDFSSGEHAIARDMFACFIWRDGSANWTGQMVDASGASALRNVGFNDTMLCFTQQDTDGGDIDYEFIPVEGVWMGNRWGNRTGNSDVNCIVTEAPEQMFKSRT